MARRMELSRYMRVEREEGRIGLKGALCEVLTPRGGE